MQGLLSWCDIDGWEERVREERGGAHSGVRRGTGRIEGQR